MNLNNCNIYSVKDSLLETPFSISKLSKSNSKSYIDSNNDLNDEPSDLLSLSKSKEASLSGISESDNKQINIIDKIDVSCTPSVCNYYDKSNAETPCSNIGEKDNKLNEISIKQVNLNLVYNNLNNGSSCEDLVTINSNNNMYGGSVKKTPIKYTKRQCAGTGVGVLERKNLMEKFTNSEKNCDGNLNLNNNKINKKKYEFNNVIVQRNEDIEFLNENKESDENQTNQVENGIYKECNNHYSNFSFDITHNTHISTNNNQKKENNNINKVYPNGFKIVIDNTENRNTIGGSIVNNHKNILKEDNLSNFITPFPINKINPFKKRNSYNGVYTNYAKNENNNTNGTRSFSSKSSKTSKSHSKDKKKPKLIYHDVTPITLNNSRKSSTNKKNNGENEIQKNNYIKKNYSTAATSSLIKQIKLANTITTPNQKMKFISNLSRTSKSKSKSKSRSKSKSNHQKIKTQINLQSILSKFDSFSSRDKKRNPKSLYSFTNIINEQKQLSANNTINNNITNINNTNNITIVTNKVIHTQETVNTTANNNYTAANTTISSVKKSPKVIQDFSFYKKKNMYNTHFVSKTNHNSLLNNQNFNNNNNGKENYSTIVPLSKKCPIVSIKLKKLNGDNDSIAGDY